ncbi:lysophospholipid acyltransferase family protein [Dongia sp.]|uniref:lysophospholipid acyltransferase family protein n=1 Tax=Dongia sp. TaxID=1977262 RepID=UPI0035AE70E9
MFIDRLNHVWRIAGTGFSFACFFGGGLVLAVTIFPAIALMMRDQERRVRATQNVIRHSFRGFVAMLETLGILNLTVTGAETLRDGKGRLVIANHPTLLDVVFLMALMPRVQCIVKSDLWRHPYLGGVVRWAGYIRNDLEPEALLQACRESIAAGKNLIIFPEGTRSRPGEPLHFRRGFANIAMLAEVETQLVVISCRPIMLSKGDPWWKVPPRKADIRMKIGARLRAAETFEHQARSLAARHLVRQLQQYFTEQLAHG